VLGSAVPRGQKGRSSEAEVTNAAAEQEGQDPALNLHPSSCRGEPRPPQSPMKVRAGGSPVSGGFLVLFLNVQGLHLI